MAVDVVNFQFKVNSIKKTKETTMALRRISDL